MKKFYAIINLEQKGGKVSKLTYFSKAKHGFQIYTDHNTDIISMDSHHSFTKGDIVNLKNWMGQHQPDIKRKTGKAITKINVISVDDFNDKYKK